MKKSGFVSIRLLITFGFIALILVFVARNLMPKYQAKLYDLTYKNEVQKISDAIDELPYTQDVSSFFSTCMYLNSEPENYNLSSGVFLRNYIGVVRECNKDSKDCFARKYKDLSNKTYSPKFEGSCGVLKSGAVFCLKPQIYDKDMIGIMDVNGESEPNILDVDLRTFKIGARKKSFEKSNETGEITILKAN